jgi:hypothetical protein
MKPLVQLHDIILMPFIDGLTSRGASEPKLASVKSPSYLYYLYDGKKNQNLTTHLLDEKHI